MANVRQNENRMTIKPSLKFWKAVPGLAVGAFVGLLVLITLHVGYYGLMEYRPNMGPQVAYFFSPILLAVVLLLALPLEAFFCLWHTPSTYLQAGFVGAAYSTLFTWWAFPDHGQIFIGVNPLTLRTLLCLTFRSSRPASPAAQL